MEFIGLFIFACLVGFIMLIGGLWITAYVLRGNMFSQQQRNMTACFWLMVINRLLRAKIHVTGRENLPHDSFVVIANHASMMDILALCEAIPTGIAFVAKDELVKLPFIGAWMTTMKCIFINREDVRGSIKLINETGVEQVKSGLPMVIFPEGTRSLSHDVAPFKGGSFSLATNAKAPVVPITIENSYKVTKNFPKKTQIYVTIHPVITPEVYEQETRNQLAAKTYEQVVSGFTHVN